MACKEGQFHVIELLSINLNAQHVNGMTSLAVHIYGY